MKLLADECIERNVVERLRQAGFDVIAVTELRQGASDTSVIKLANKNQAILLTADKDFGELVFREGWVTNGVVLIRLHGLSSNDKGEIVTYALESYQDEIVGSFCVIEPTQIRIRSTHR